MDSIIEKIKYLKDKINKLKDSIYSNTRNLVICSAIMLVFIKTPFVFWLCVVFDCIYFLNIITNFVVYITSKKTLKEFEKVLEDYSKTKSRNDFYKKSGNNYYSDSDNMRSGYTNYGSGSNNYNFNGKSYNDQAYEDMLKDLYEKLHNRANQNRERYQQQNKSNEYENALNLFKLNHNSTEAEFKKKFRELSKTWHPDMFSTSSKSSQETANRNFQKLNNAYQVIKKNKGFN